MSAAARPEAARHDRLRAELARRMARPQRHRLLQGYPMAPLLQPVGAAPRADVRRDVRRDPGRPLLVGVLPHTYCNPKVRGCGFCTFPHEQFAKAPMRQVLDQVVAEIALAGERDPTLRQRHVAAVYLGGGTANLTPPEDLARLCAQLSATFDLRHSELSLEGVPRYFLLRDQALLDVLARTDVRHRRISMGVQTFDAAWLRRMGRDAFGDRDEVQEVVAAAHRRGFTASADLLFNLPGASVEHALADVQAAIELGFDQICTYNLVLTPELGTVWAQDSSLLRARPDQATALASWLAVRARLLEHGFEQTTLTNFERAEVARTPRRFAYEVASFDPATYDALGFGPGAISTFTSDDHQAAVKWMNLDTSAAFTQAMATRGTAMAKTFYYQQLDLRLFHLTRGLSRMTIQGEPYQRFFGTGLKDDFAPHLELLADAGLLRDEGQDLWLTPAGMFYADAVAGLLAHERILELRAPTDDVAAARQHMG